MMTSAPKMSESHIIRQVTALEIPTSRSDSRNSPLRYPGGKASMTQFFSQVIDQLHLNSPLYVEPYAGGAGAGIALLLQGKIEQLVINDFDGAVASFWKAVVTDTAEFIDKISSVPLTIDEWKKQRSIYLEGDNSDSLRLGFAFFYLNRTNRSGILKAGVIGGMKQTGNYLIDARFNRDELSRRIQRIGEHSDQILVTKRDGRAVVREYVNSPNAFLYIDPPYVGAGKSLYMNSFDYRDHFALAQLLCDSRSANWILTYDDKPEVHQLYADLGTASYGLHYSAGSVRNETELLIASDAVRPILSGYRQSDERQ